MISRIEEMPVQVRSMTHEDLPMVSDIERRSYEFPWSHGVFRDCLLAGYGCVVLEHGDGLAGYGILSIAAGEAHVLNLCVDPQYRSLGFGGRLLDEVLARARLAEVREVFLEVRPSNTNAISLYRKRGFHRIARRAAYYQSRDGREDAEILSLRLQETD